MKKTFVWSLASVLLASFLLGGCSQPQPSALSDEEVKQKAEQILAALDSEDYIAFSQDFSEAMLEAFSEGQFADLRNSLQEASGKYQSCDLPSLSNRQGYAIYRLICQFEREKVVMTLVFAVHGDQVEGLFFDSPNLRVQKR